MFPQLQTIEWIYKPIDDELSMYTTMRKYTDDALEFWNETQKILPILSKVAKIFLGIEASSSPSERSFKELRYLVSNFTRNRMHPEFNATLVQLRNSYLQETL
ncbi:zinc finger BED domain-containing protein 1-like [Ditylenchus destructor]|nr:zinc finger BED domain-containing protein 1-like [Ditylenchus destructor]